MKLIHIVLSVLAISAILFLLNVYRYIRTALYHFAYTANCKAGNFRANIKYFPSVTRLFKKAGTNKIDIRTRALVSESLEDPDYENIINLCFEKTKSVFRDRFLRPWYILQPITKHESLLLNRLLSLIKWVLLFLLNQVSSNVLETLGIGDILVDKACLMFPWLSSFLDHFSPH